MQDCWSLAASLEPLVHRRNVTSLSLFYRYYFARCSLELAQLVPLPFSRGRSPRYCDRLHVFSVTIPRCYKDVYVNSFFPRMAKLWISLPIECFSLVWREFQLKKKVRQNYIGQVSKMSQGFMGGSKCRINSPAYSFLHLIQ